MKINSRAWFNWIPLLAFAGLMLLGLPLAVAHAQSVTLAGTVTLGTGLSGATVTAATVDLATGGFGGMTLGSTISDSNGDFSITFENAPDGPVRILATGGSFVSPQDGTTITSRNLVSVLLADVTGSMSGISVNPLTKFVNDQTVADLAHGTSEFATALAAATATIEADYGLGSDPATLLPDYTTSGIGTDAGNLGLILGGLANLDEHLATANCQPGGLMTVLSADLADGVFDGANFGTPLKYCGVALPAIAGISDFQDALSGLYQLQLITSGFAFGGTGNLLTANGIAASQLVASVGTIETALTNTAPPSVNTFAPPNQTATMLRAYYLTTATPLANGRVLIAGGWGPNGFGPASTTQIYDPVKNTFVAGPSMKVARNQATAVRLQNGKVLIVGGQGQQGASSSTEVYDPTTNSFAPSTPSMNVARSWATATLLPDGRVLIAGGINTSSVVLGSTEIYDPATNSFVSSPPPLLTPRYLATATLLPNGQVLIAGGFLGEDLLNSTESYDSVTDTFTAGPNMNAGHAQATATLLTNGKILIAGGPAGNDDLYDSVANSFAVFTPPLDAPRASAAAVLLRTGDVLIAGGSYIGASLTSSEIYYPIMNSFALTTPSMNVARDLPVAAPLSNGKVLIVGGSTVNGSTRDATSSTELFTP